MSSAVAYPVQLLREHLTALEAAITVCLATPDGKPVHRLRTETRRVEALLLLLALVPGLPEHREQAAALLRSLSRLRRAAGEVRDLDVHRKMLEDFAAQEQALPPGDPAAPAQAAGQRDGADPKAAKDAVRLSQAAAKLRKRMGGERDKAASALQSLLVRRQAKTAVAAEALLKVLAPAETLAVSAADVLRDAQAVLLRDGLLQAEAVTGLKEDDLHQVRKAAKAARYVAESLPEDDALAEAARGFESLQEAGGQWHDALELARAARRYFGKKHQLTTTYRKQRDSNLRAYRVVLSARAQASAGESAKRKAAKSAGSGRKSSATRRPVKKVPAHG